MRRDSEGGFVSLKSILALLLFSVFGYVCARVFPPYFANSQLKDKMYEEARFAEANDRSTEQLRDNVLREAQRLQIPLRREDIKVDRTLSGTRITADYTVSVNLYYVQPDWSFHTTSQR
ncbi:MAG: hypothetical protein ACE145_08115 [Terriglobia bacterium]